MQPPQWHVTPGQRIGQRNIFGSRTDNSNTEPGNSNEIKCAKGKCVNVKREKQYINKPFLSEVTVP